MKWHDVTSENLYSPTELQKNTVKQCGGAAALGHAHLPEQGGNAQRCHGTQSVTGCPHTVAWGQRDAT